jgi:hypothetical protein
MYESDFFRMIDDHAGRLPTDERPAFFARLGRESLELLDRPADAEIVRGLAAWWLADTGEAETPITPRSPAPTRRQRKPTLASVAKQVVKAGIEVARYEVKPDGTVTVVTGKSEATEANPWLDDLKVTRQ